MRTKINSRSGFTLIELMIVLVIISFLLSLAIPNYRRSREAAQFHSIRNNLRVYEGAKQQWALERRKISSDAVSITDLDPYLKSERPVVAVAGEIYTISGSSQVADLVMATLSAGSTLLGNPGPFTTTSF